MLGRILPAEFAEVSVVGVQLFVHVHLYVDDSRVNHRRGVVVGFISWLVDLRMCEKTPFDTLAVAQLGRA